MKVKHAKLCLDCDEIYSNGQKCPACASPYYHPLSTWVPSMKQEREELIQAATVEVWSERWWWRLPLVGKYFRPVNVAY